MTQLGRCPPRAATPAGRAGIPPSTPRHARIMKAVALTELAGKSWHRDETAVAGRRVGGHRPITAGKRAGP
jgi:hypothetical protein